MKIVDMEIRNFLSFREPALLPMSDLGLVLVKGDNRISRAADSNGAGKSSIFSALAWALYGETLNGLKADAVVCRFGTGETNVSLRIEDERGAWSIIRGRRPNRLSIADERGFVDSSDPQVYIVDRIGMGFRTFRNAVIFGQGAFERFAQADQADQLRMLDEIQGLDFRGALDRAKTWKDESHKRLGELQQEANSLSLEIDSQDRMAADLVIAHNAFSSSKQVRISEAEERVTEARSALASMEEDIKKATEAKGKIDRLRKAIENRRSIENKRRLAENSISTLDAYISTAEAEIKDFESKLVELSQVTSCPTCYQKVSPDVIKKTVGKLIEDEQKALAQHRKERKEQEKIIEQADKTLEMVGADPVEELGRMQALAQNLPGMIGARKPLQEKVAAALREVEKEKAAEWEGAGALKAAQTALAETRSRITEVQRLIKRAVVTFRVAEYWVEAFGDRGIRSLLVDSVAGFLNERLQDHLSVLAGGEAKTMVSAQTQLKGGGARERLSVSSVWAWGGAEKGSGSAGQDRRIDLALFASLQDLAESRAARPFPLRIWDEPGDALDGRGQELFVSWVSREARLRGTGFLVTHSAQLAEAVVPDQTWTVILDRNGSRVEMT